MTLDDFLTQPIAHTCDAEELNLWDSRSFKEQMQDVYGEAARLVKYHAEKNSKLKMQWSVFDRFCTMTCLAPSTTEGERETLRIAEYELYDFVFGENEFRNDTKTVMRWFDQWVFDVNYAALSEG